MQQGQPASTACSDDDDATTIVVFRVGPRRSGIALCAVERVIPAVECRAIPGTPPAVIGIVSLHGTAVPVLDLARRFGDGGGPLRLDSRFVIVRTPSRPVALVVDRVEGVRAIPSAAIARMEDLVPGAGMLEGVAAEPEGLIYLHDVDALLTASEEAVLAVALDGRTP